MKLFIVSASFILMSMFSFAQNSAAKIVEAYGQVRYDQMASTNPGALELLGKFSSHGFDVSEMNPKYNNQTLLSQVNLRSKNSANVSVEEFMNDYNSGAFNILGYDFFPTNETQIFRLDGYNKVLIIYSQQSILSK